MTEAVMTPDSRKKIDLTDWSLDAFDKHGERLTERLVLSAASEAIRIAATEYDAMVNFHTENEYDEGNTDGPIGDLLTMQIMIPLGQEYDGPTWDFSFTEVVDTFIESRVHCNGPWNGLFGPQDQPALRKLKSILLAQIEKIDAVLPPSGEPQ